jgi:hypothetical protein
MMGINKSVEQAEQVIDYYGSNCAIKQKARNLRPRFSINR